MKKYSIKVMSPSGSIQHTVIIQADAVFVEGECIYFKLHGTVSRIYPSRYTIVEQQ